MRPSAAEERDRGRVARQRPSEGNPPRLHLKRVVRPALGLLDRQPAPGISGEQRRLRVALLQKPRDPVIGRNPLAIAGEARHRAQQVPDREARGGAARRAACLAARVESVQPRDERVQERDHVDAPVRHPLVLEHEHRRAARV